VDPGRTVVVAVEEEDSGVEMLTKFNNMVRRTRSILGDIVFMKGYFIKIGMILLSFLWIFIIYKVAIFEMFELDVFDFRFRSRGTLSNRLLEEIIIVDIDEKSLKELGRFGEWPRSYYAQVIDYLAYGGAKVIGFDILFSEPSRIFSEGDQSLAEATRKARNVCHAILFEYKGLWRTKTIPTIPESLVKFSYGQNTKSYPLNAIPDTLEEPLLPWGKDSVLLPIEPILKETHGIGYVNFSPDMDGVIRRIQPLMAYMGEIYPSLAFQIASDYLGIKKEDVKIVRGKFIDLGRFKIPIDEEGRMLINYKLSSVRRISYSVVLKKKIPANFFKDRIVLIGGTAAGLFDLSPTPLDPLSPGVEIHANIIYNIIKGDFLISLGRATNIAISLLLGLLTGIFLWRLRSSKGIIATILLLIGYLILTFYLFKSKGICLEVFRPASVIMLVAFIRSMCLAPIPTSNLKRIQGVK
jgi:adenylate cyclase